MLAVALAALSINAQNQKEDLHKEITLDKDFVPVEKKATKKNALPAVARPKLSTSATKLNYSDWVQPTEVTTDIPTLLPYGYRTAHLFNDKRGYFLVGGGTQANFTGAFGYRIVDTEKNKVALWLQHNSSWNGRNSSMELPDGMERVKQQLNDNLLKLDYTGQVGKGTLELGLNGHLDNFNYYGGWMPYNRTGAYVDWGKLKQTYHHVDAHGAWSSSLTVRDDHEVNYNAGLQVGHSGYAEGIDYNKGIQETAFTANVGAGYTLASGSIVGLNITGEYLKHNIKAINDNYSRGMITFNPYYTLDGARYHLHAGVNMHVSMSDGATLRFSPDVRFDAELAGGLSFFASATGGKDMGYIVFSQLVSITSYTDDELMDLIRLVNDVRPHAVSIVDTYGLLHKGNLFHYYEMLDRHGVMWNAMGHPCCQTFVPWYAGITQAPEGLGRFKTWQEAEKKHMTDAKNKRKNYPNHFYWKFADNWDPTRDPSAEQREILRERKKFEKETPRDYNAFIRKFY